MCNSHVVVLQKSQKYGRVKERASEVQVGHEMEVQKLSVAFLGDFAS